MVKLGLVCLFVIGFATEVRSQESVLVSLLGTRIIITGTSRNDSIGVSVNQTDVLVRVSGRLVNQYPRASVRSVRAVLSSGDDSFIADGFPIACTVQGQSGNDTIVGGNSADSLIGGEGRDIVVGGLGADSIQGNLGEDFLVGGSLSQNALATVKLNWFIPNNRFVTRVAAIRTASVVALDDRSVDTIDGGEDLEPDVFLGSSTDAVDLRVNFNPQIDVSSLTATAEVQRMNIVLITADDLGFHLGCYGDKVATTPNIDAFAASGCRFTKGYVVQASCSPSRAAMLTGLYPHQSGQVANVIPPLASTGQIPYQMKDGIDTLPSILQRNGYYTGIIGKLHVEPASAFSFNYRALGTARSRDSELLLGHLNEFNNRRGTRPFFLMLNIFDPHRPMLRDINGSPLLKVTSDKVPNGLPFNTDRTPERLLEIADYYTCVNRLDELMGRVHAFFTENNWISNTVFVFVSDNGPAFDRAKTTSFEAGVTLPFMIRWPGVTIPNQVEENLVSTIDLMPTLLTAAKLPIPSGLPGRSMQRLLSTGADSGWRQSYCAEYTAHGIDNYGPQRTIRKGQYKLILNLLADPAVFPNGMLGDQLLSTHLKRAVGPFVQLFDLNADPYEMTIISDNPDLATVKAELLEELLAWRIRTDDPMLDAEFLKSYTQWHIDNQPAQISLDSE